MARPETAAAIRDDGLTLVYEGAELRRAARGRGGSWRSRSSSCSSRVKAPRARETPSVAYVAEPELVLPLLNGLEHMAVLRERFAIVMAATIGRLEAYREAPTRIVQHKSGARDRRAERSCRQQLVRAGMADGLGGSEEDVLWEKLARQAPLAVLTSVTGKPTARCGPDPRLRSAVEEAVRSRRRRRRSHDVRRAMERSSSPCRPGLTTSTARDVAAGRPSELDAIGGAVVRAGRRLGVPTPTLEELLAACPA